MGWNTGSNKSLNGGQQKSALNAGAPIAFDAGRAGKPYKDGWDIERAYREGMQKVTWVFRCIDAIAGNQSRLPVMLRTENDQRGERVKEDRPILELMNSKSNMGENSFVFRYRLSAQLLIGSRGAFIEKVRGRDGRIIALHLLPPQHTAPIPDPKKFVAGYEVDMRNGKKITLKPEDVCWVRRPHPLDPYLSVTPMESAGIAIELENLAKLYNRNYLLNDGRPGGLLVVRGDIEEDDKQELKSRFRGNLSRTGYTSVISSSDGVDYVDTSASPRDAAYIQLRQIQKEEILSAFGVPESVMGNASGRTFSNAAEELRVFWMETMIPHLHTISRALDELDDDYYVDFDTSDIPILIISKQERERYNMDEFQQGLISVNEYRQASGRKKVDSELADSLLSNPNLTPIANTEKPFKPEEQQPVDMIGAPAPGAPMPGMEGATAQVPGAPDAMPPAPTGVAPEMGGASPQTGALPPEQQLSAFEEAQGVMQRKFVEEVETKADSDTDRWTEIMDRALERLFERQQRVIVEKAFGKKAAKALAAGTLTADMFFDVSVWNKQLADDVKPVLLGVMNDAKEYVASMSNMPVQVDQEELEKTVDEHVTRMQQVNQSTLEEIAAAVLVAMAVDNEDEKSQLLRTALAAIFVNLLKKNKRTMAEHESQSAFNSGVFLSGKDLGGLTKTWIARKDSKVRATHLFLDGKTVPFGDEFSVGGEAVRFPGDPLSPASLTYNCRCKLRFRFE
jgi:HK97 family phage portal protein